MYLKMVIIAIIQGITEFLPVSSSGHMLMLERFLHYNPRGTALEIILHLATLLSVTVFFNKKLLELLTIRGDKNNPLLLILIATIPAGIVGVLFNDRIEAIFDNSSYLWITFLFNGFILLSFYFAEKKVMFTGEQHNSPIKALFIGIAQTFAILPGISRSGSTITSARWMKLQREDAFDFSFYLLFPAVIGALVLKSGEVGKVIFSPLYIMGFCVAFVSGVVALYFLRKIVIKGKLYLFGIYTILLAVFLLFTT